MNFKEILQNDTKSTFLNLNEFAEIHELADAHGLNAVRVPAIIDDDFLSELTLKFNDEAQREAPGLFGGTIAIYIAKDDFGRIKPGRALKLDGKLHTVNSTTEQDGVLKIVATRTGG